MQPAAPMPIFLNETGSADRGLICGYRLAEGRTPLEVAPDGVLQAFASDQGVTWLHFNLSDARARRWLLHRVPCLRRCARFCRSTTGIGASRPTTAGAARDQRLRLRG